MYQFLFDNLYLLLKNNYYDKHIIYNNVNTKFFIKFDYLLYYKFYLIYLFLFYLNQKNFLLYSFFLYFQKMMGELPMKLNDNYKIKMDTNIHFLYTTSNYFFLIILFSHIYFSKKVFSLHKFFIFLNIGLFKLGNITQKIYKKRLKCIENDEEFEDTFDFLFLIPNMENINKTLIKTKFMDDKNFYIFIHFILFLFY
jgi:hypothetical protein